MADKELIIGLLEKIRQRLRYNRRVKAISRGLAAALLFLLLFKLVDLVFPFRGMVVAIALAIWGSATAALLIWKSRGRETMSEAAASLDRSAQMQDQVKTAYWFIRHPSSYQTAQSEWIDVQIRRTVQHAGPLDIDKLYARTIPSGFYIALALLLAVVTLNFLPQSLNHNWFYLQGAPPFQLSRADQAMVNHAKKLLDKTEAAGELEKIVSDLEQGKISSESAQQQLADLRQQIDNGNLELNNILDGLTSMANQLGQSAALASTAQAMSEGDLTRAADEVRSLAEKLGTTPADVLRELQKNMAQAGNSSNAALQDLSKRMQQASDALKNDDPQMEKSALESLAQAMEQLAQKMQGQQQQSQASQQLADLQNALQQEAAADSAADTQQVSIPSQGEGSGGTSGDQAAGGAPKAGDASGNGRGSQSGGPSGSTGLGSAEDLKPGQMTKLDVQLKMEGLKGQASKGGQLQDIEEASRQEKSAMDYRNVPSQLSPAQKDALNQNRLPREQREIVKTYFEEIRPQAPKAIK